MCQKRPLEVFNAPEDSRRQPVIIKLQHFQAFKVFVFLLSWPPVGDHITKHGPQTAQMWSRSDWKVFQKPACKFQQQLCNLVKELLLSTLVAGILLSGLNTCVEFAPVAMESAKCSAEITSVGVYTRIENLKILFLWGCEINILSKCWKWDSTLHVSKQNLSNKVRESS